MLGLVSGLAVQVSGFRVLLLTGLLWVSPVCLCLVARVFWLATGHGDCLSGSPAVGGVCVATELFAH